VGNYTTKLTIDFSSYNDAFKSMFLDEDDEDEKLEFDYMYLNIDERCWDNERCLYYIPINDFEPTCKVQSTIEITELDKTDIPVVTEDGDGHSLSVTIEGKEDYDNGIAWMQASPTNLHLEP